jgi:outer membrane protein OmpA-like peptidoglycan-associated protein
MRSALLSLALLVGPAHAEPLVDHDASVTCRAAHAASAPGCPRHVRRRGDRLDVTPLVFEYDKGVLRPASLAVIRDLALYLRGHPQVRIEIQGHNGFDESHRAMRLSDRRARSVRDALVHAGVEPDRLTAQGFGDSVPLVLPKTHADRVHNTRIELRIVP